MNRLLQKPIFTITLVFGPLFLVPFASTISLRPATAQVVASEPNRSETPLVQVPSGYFVSLAKEMKKNWPANRRIHIVFHGHSVPAGYFKTPRVHTFEAYPHLTHLQLNRAFPTATIDVSVTAIGGENSEQGARRFQKDVCSTNPDVITIDYGLNDRRIGLKRAKSAWDTMIQEAKDCGARIILLTPTPDVKEDLFDTAGPLARHAQQIRQLAKEHDVALVDSYEAFAKEIRTGRKLAEFMSQSNHPNQAGHQIVADQMEAVFNLGANDGDKKTSADH